MTKVEEVVKLFSPPGIYDPLMYFYEEYAAREKELARDFLLEVKKRKLKHTVEKREYRNKSNDTVETAYRISVYTKRARYDAYFIPVSRGTAVYIRRKISLPMYILFSFGIAGFFIGSYYLFQKGYLFTLKYLPLTLALYGAIFGITYFVEHNVFSETVREAINDFDARWYEAKITGAPEEAEEMPETNAEKELLEDIEE